MPDVVQGRLDEERPSGLPDGVRRLVLVLVVAVAAFLVSRSGLLSAGGAGDEPDGPTGALAEPFAEVSRLVGVADGHLVLRDQDGWSEGARLPDSLTTVLPVPDPIVGLPSRTPGTLAGVAGGRLFVVGTEPGSDVRPIGRARTVVAATSSSLVVWRGERVVEVDLGTGRVLDPDPFPGFNASAASAGWSPEGLVAVTGSRPLLMSRPLPDGRQELALAWPTRRIEAGTNPPVQPLGTYGVLMGIADDWILAQGNGCPGDGCTVQVVSVTRDDVLVRDVAPPTGWVFGGGPVVGRTSEALLQVSPRGYAVPASALSRVVPGGSNALLVGGTEGVDLDAGIVGSADGAVFFVVRPPSGRTERVWTWDANQTGRAEPVPGPVELPQSTRLVCVCG